MKILVCNAGRWESNLSNLWNLKRIVPFLKVDKGLAEEYNGARLMKPMPELPSLLKKAQQSDAEFNTVLDSGIQSSFAASRQPLLKRASAKGSTVKVAA